MSKFNVPLAVYVSGERQVVGEVEFDLDPIVEKIEDELAREFIKSTTEAGLVEFQLGIGPSPIEKEASDG